MNTPNNKLAALIGSASGLIEYLSKLNNGHFVDNLIGATITAFICGAVGILGKLIFIDLYNYIFHKNKSQKDV